ncbi:DEAD/DEAH box helicase [Saccharopolyspora shandongensis]|uniref:DEAD/DEAH box helicase n=1 Tax=Saccharopolyspora shandongensis TaxID=418495 RepID=UPI0033FF88A1
MSEDRYYQVEAVHRVGLGLREGGRGQLLSACGTGKTKMAQWSAEQLCRRGGVVVVVCPSIALVAQTLREWAADNHDHIALAVCGDDTVADSLVTAQDLPAAVTTDPGTVASWLRTPSAVGLRLIVGTHRSAHVIGAGLQQAGLVADLLIVDEAHYAAGLVDKHVALVHDDERLPARRRLYATATAKIISGRRRQAVGMDDEAVFGPVLYRYPVAQAIADGYLDDYRLVVMGVTRREIMEHLARLPRDAIAGSSPTSLHTAMVQTVLARAAREFGLRRVLTFCRRINEAADFARSMRTTLSALPADMKPDRPLHTSHVHGGMSTTEREEHLAKLTEPPRDGWTVITNVRCLAEGVDVPAIDGVVFTHPKKSTADIVQAVGRALRRDPHGTGVATILVPILLPEDADDDAVDVQDYAVLWQVVRALRAHDDVFGTALDRARAQDGSRHLYEPAPLEHVQVNLPEGYDDGSFLRHLTARIVTSGTDEWWNGFDALSRYHAEYDSATMKPGHVTADGVKLGAWCERARTAHRHGRLAPERVAALEELGFDFLPRAAEWAAGVQAARRFHAEHGHLEPVRSLRVDGVDLHAWLDKQRARAAAGDLEDSRTTVLDALGMRWSARPESFEDYLHALTAFHARHGHIDIAPDPDTPEGRLGYWLVTARTHRKTHKLSADQIAALDTLGMQWRPHRRHPTPALRGG